MSHPPPGSDYDRHALAKTFRGEVFARINEQDVEGSVRGAYPYVSCDDDPDNLFAGTGRSCLFLMQITSTICDFPTAILQQIGVTTTKPFVRDICPASCNACPL